MLILLINSSPLLKLWRLDWMFLEILIHFRLVKLISLIAVFFLLMNCKFQLVMDIVLNIEYLKDNNIQQDNQSELMFQLFSTFQLCKLFMRMLELLMSKFLLGI